MEVEGHACKYCYTFFIIIIVAQPCSSGFKFSQLEISTFIRGIHLKFHTYGDG